LCVKVGGTFLLNRYGWQATFLVPAPLMALAALYCHMRLVDDAAGPVFTTPIAVGSFKGLREGPGGGLGGTGGEGDEGGEGGEGGEGSQASGGRAATVAVQVVTRAGTEVELALVVTGSGEGDDEPETDGETTSMLPPPDGAQRHTPPPPSLADAMRLPDVLRTGCAYFFLKVQLESKYTDQPVSMVARMW
jgi:hypothetical protein